MAGVTGAVDWHNERLPADVDDDGDVTPRDALIVLNDLIASGPRQLAAPVDGPQYRLDVDGNGWTTPADVLTIIETLAGDLAAAQAGDSRPGDVSAGDVLAGDVSTHDGIDGLNGVRTNLGWEDEIGEGEEPSLNALSVGVVAAPGARTPCGPVPLNGGAERLYLADSGETLDDLPEWQWLDDRANEGVVISDRIFPYSSFGTPISSNDDTGYVYPIKIDYPLIDDSHLAWLEVVGVRRYSVADRLRSWSNDSPDEMTPNERVVATIKKGLTTTRGFSVEIGREFAIEAEKVTNKVSGKYGYTFSQASMSELAITTETSVGMKVRPCTALSFYNVQLVTEVMVDYVYMQDVVGGELFGFTPVAGRTVITFNDSTGTRTSTSPNGEDPSRTVLVDFVSSLTDDQSRSDSPGAVENM